MEVSGNVSVSLAKVCVVDAWAGNYLHDSLSPWTVRDMWRQGLRRHVVCRPNLRNVPPTSQPIQHNAEIDKISGHALVGLWRCLWYHSGWPLRFQSR